MPLLGSTPDPQPTSATRRSASKQSTPATTMFDTVTKLDSSPQRESLFGGIHSATAPDSADDAFAAPKPATRAKPNHKEPLPKREREPREPASSKPPAKPAAAKSAPAEKKTVKRTGDHWKTAIKDAGGNYEVAEILSERQNKDTGRTEYRVRWKGYSTRHNTWEPVDNLSSSQDLLREFTEAKKRVEEKRSKGQIKKRVGHGEKWKNAYSRREKRTLRSGRK